MSTLGRASASPLRGDEQFRNHDLDQTTTVTDFWRWSCSDLLSNTLRGVLAEFIVAKALGVEATVRAEWDDVDLRLLNGKTVEVKSSAYPVWSEYSGRREYESRRWPARVALIPDQQEETDS